MTEQQTQKEESQNQEVVEISWEEIQPLMVLRNNLANAERELAKLLVEYEKRKLSYLDHVSSLENAVMEQAKALQEAKNLDKTIGYELKMPTAPSEKGYFVRKDP